LRTIYIVSDVTDTLSYELFKLLSAEPPQQLSAKPTPGLRAHRQRQLIQRVEKRSQAWTPEMLVQKQKEDPDLKRVAEWLTNGSRPEWNEVLGFSPAKKAYWNQYESLSLVSGVIYRTISPETDAEEELKQLFMPQGLKI